MEGIPSTTAVSPKQANILEILADQNSIITKIEDNITFGEIRNDKNPQAVPESKLVAIADTLKEHNTRLVAVLRKLDLLV